MERLRQKGRFQILPVIIAWVIDYANLSKQIEKLRFTNLLSRGSGWSTNC